MKAPGPLCAGIILCQFCLSWKRQSKYARHCVGLWKENMTDTDYAPNISWPGNLRQEKILEQNEIGAIVEDEGMLLDHR